MRRQFARNSSQARWRYTRYFVTLTTIEGRQLSADDKLRLLERIRSRTDHPESTAWRSGLIARPGASCAIRTSVNLGRARVILSRWVAHYDTERLHAALGYLPAARYYRGTPAERQAERRQRLAAARTRRRELNGQRLQAGA